MTCIFMLLYLIFVRYLPRTRGRTKKKRQHKLHMNDPHCVAAEFTRNRKFEILKFRTKFDECGTIEEFANNRLVYKQTIQTFKSKINSRIRPLKLEFQCDIRFSPATHLVPKYLKGNGHASLVCVVFLSPPFGGSNYRNGYVRHSVCLFVLAFICYFVPTLPKNPTVRIFYF